MSQEDFAWNTDIKSFLCSHFSINQIHPIIKYLRKTIIGIFITSKNYFYLFIVYEVLKSYSIRLIGRQRCIVYICMYKSFNSTLWTKHVSPFFFNFKIMEISFGSITHIWNKMVSQWKRILRFGIWLASRDDPSSIHKWTVQVEFDETTEFDKFFEKFFDRSLILSLQRKY